MICSMKTLHARINKSLRISKIENCFWCAEMWWLHPFKSWYLQDNTLFLFCFVRARKLSQFLPIESPKRIFWKLLKCLYERVFRTQPWIQKHVRCTKPNSLDLVEIVLRAFHADHAYPVLTRAHAVRLNPIVTSQFPRSLLERCSDVHARSMIHAFRNLLSVLHLQVHDSRISSGAFKSRMLGCIVAPCFI